MAGRELEAAGAPILLKGGETLTGWFHRLQHAPQGGLLVHSLKNGDSSERQCAGRGSELQPVVTDKHYSESM